MSLPPSLIKLLDICVAESVIGEKGDNGFLRCALIG